MESGEAKKRAINFSAKEETVLIELAKKYKHQVECRKSDTNTNKIKTQAWVVIAKEFNNICGDVYRDSKVLRNKYENLKKRTKQKFAEEKKYRMGTGGGPVHVVNIDSVDMGIKDIIGTQLTGFASEFGGDCVENEVSIMVENEPLPPEQLIMEDMDGVVSSEDSLDVVPIPSTSGILKFGKPVFGKAVTENVMADWLPDDHSYTAERIAEDWSKCTPEMLRTPKSAPLQINAGTKQKENTPNRNPLSKKMLHWAERKVELADLQKQCFLEQHQLKMKLMVAEHEERIRLMRKESEARITRQDK